MADDDHWHWPANATYQPYVIEFMEFFHGGMEYERNEFFVMRTEATVGEGKYIMSYGEEKGKGST